MYEMQTIVTDGRGVCPSVCSPVCQASELGGACSVCGAFVGVFAKLFCLLSEVVWSNGVQILSYCSVDQVKPNFKHRSLIHTASGTAPVRNRAHVFTARRQTHAIDIVIPSVSLSVCLTVRPSLTLQCGPKKP